MSAATASQSFWKTSHLQTLAFTSSVMSPPNKYKAEQSFHFQVNYSFNDLTDNNESKSKHSWWAVLGSHTTILLTDTPAGLVGAALIQCAFSMLPHRYPVILIGRAPSSSGHLPRQSYSPKIVSASGQWLWEKKTKKHFWPFFGWRFTQ